MTKPIIKINNLSKCYRIGTKEKGYKTFREAIIDGISAPFRNLKRLQRLTRFNNKGDDARSNDIIWALKDISCEISEGEVLGIIGKNGAGKTTLLKILSRITEPTSGIIEINGRVSSLLEVGTGFHPELTGRENIFLTGAILGMRKKEIEQKFDEIVSFAEIEKFLDTPVKRYSSGMYVRLAFAVAAHLEPEILLVDEVLAVGDFAFQEKCLGKMGDVAKRGRTVLFVSHNMLAMKNLCTKGIVIENGKIVCFDTISVAIEKYLMNKPDLPGEICWNSPEIAPGNHQVRLKAVRIVSDGKISSNSSLDKDIEIQVDYWNLEKGGRRLVSIHLFNSMGFLLLASGNLNSASLTPDSWVNKKYPVGLFRTTCVIPKYLLNTGMYSVSLYINGTMDRDNIILKKNIISFDVKDSDERKDYLGKWIGAIRPKLAWSTEKIE